MAHLSENSEPLPVKALNVGDIREYGVCENGRAGVYLFVLSDEPKGCGKVFPTVLEEELAAFIEGIGEDSIVAFLTTAGVMAGAWLKVEKLLHFKLWVSIKLKEPRCTNGELARDHIELVIFGKSGKSLIHTKTRIGYTYCPACDKTTKDYGGKKHTYHKYGTLMSDVWRDIPYEPGSYPEAVIGRLRDLFGCRPYEVLYLIDLREDTCKVAVLPERAGARKLLPADGEEFAESRLINGDCLSELKNIPSESIDYCFADPPYNLKKKYDSWDDGLDVRQYFEWCDLWLSELARVLKPGRTLSVLNIPLWAVRHYLYLASVLDFQHWIVWEGLSLPVRMIMPANYVIVSFSKGQARILPGVDEENLCKADAEELLALKEGYCLRADCVRKRWLLGESDRERIGDLWWDIHRLKHNCRRADHPCQLPPALMRRLIALYTYRGESVLDPFNGVGTTTLCAEELGRSFAGIELSENYHRIALQRHSDLRIGLDPFRKTRDVPRAKNSPVARLKKKRYAVTKKELQLEVRRIATQIGKLPNRTEVEQLGRYPVRFYDEYFVSWGEVCAAARTTGMTEVRDAGRQRKKKRVPTLFEL